MVGIRYVLESLSNTEFIVQMDADLAHHPDDIEGFLNENTLLDMVVGNRYSRYRKTDEHRSCVMSLASMTIAAATGFRLNDPMCGYRRYSASLASIFAENLGQHGYGIETEQLTLCSMHGYTVGEHDLSVVIPQDIKTKAIEFIDVFRALIAYSSQLKINSELVSSMKDSVNHLVVRKDFVFSLIGKNAYFQYVPYEDSYALKWIKN